MKTLALNLLMACVLGCNGTSMSGTGGKRTPPSESEQKKPKNKSGDSKPQAKETDAGRTTVDSKSFDDDSPVVEPQIEEAVTDPVVQPREIVAGQEVINDCGRCDERAKQLAKGAGFTADRSRTFNEGFYKVDPSRGLCDIHYMTNMTDRIAEHDGQDSVLGNQVALYCPWPCGWAVDESRFQSNPDPFDGEPSPF